jgi:hypothetical protein
MACVAVHRWSVTPHDAARRRILARRVNPRARATWHACCSARARRGRHSRRA